MEMFDWECIIFFLGLATAAFVMLLKACLPKDSSDKQQRASLTDEQHLDNLFGKK